MIERINLIEREPFKFTYRKVVMVVAAAVGLCVVLFGTLMLRLHLQNKNVAQFQAKLEALQVERDSLLKAAPTKVDTGPFSDVKGQILATPPWAELVVDIGNRLPSGTYLTNLTGASDQKIGSSDAKSDESKKSKDAKQNVKEGLITLSGVSKNPDEMSQFANELKKSPFVNTVALKTSEKSDLGYTFVIECDLSDTFNIKAEKK